MKPISSIRPQSLEESKACQPSGNAIAAKTAQNQTLKKWVLAALSCRPRWLVSSWKNELETRQPIASKAPHPRLCSPSLMIISVPASPPVTNSHCIGAMACLNTVTASTVTSMGVTMTMAVNSPMGISLSPDTAITVLAASKAPRSSCKRGWLIRNSARP